MDNKSRLIHFLIFSHSFMKQILDVFRILNLLEVRKFSWNWVKAIDFSLESTPHIHKRLIYNLLGIGEGASSIARDL